MKLLTFICVLGLIQFGNAQTDDKSQAIEDLMIRAGVESHGKKQRMYANIGCRNNRKNIFSCSLNSGTDENTLYVEYFGNEALRISNLLYSFGLKPSGRRLRQEGTFNCQILKLKINNQRICQLEVYDGVF